MTGLSSCSGTILNAEANRLLRRVHVFCRALENLTTPLKPSVFQPLGTAILLSLALQSPQANGHGFIPANFEPPIFVKTDDFIVKPLGPELMKVDYVAYMSSIEHLQTTFTRSTSWPHEGLEMEDALLDMQTEERRFKQRESFAYAVLTPDSKTELGCVYVYPSKKVGFDAVIRLWVTQEQYDLGFDTLLYDWTRSWIKSSWPFEAPAYPGRAVSWNDWNSLPAQ